METWAVVVAGGTGVRFGGPKQLVELGGRRIVDRSIDAVRPHVEGVIVVGHHQIGTPAGLGVHAVVAGGPTRSASVRAGLAALPPEVTHVLVHDAARPLASAAVVGRVIDALVDGAEAVVPVVPVTDTLRAIDGGTVDRSRLVAVQTPQGFERAALVAAHAAGANATDDAAVLEAWGHPVVHVDGDPVNIKITMPTDLAVAEALLSTVGLADATPDRGA
ncbi:MAG: 2-C-methyl-D-erythritol 4-phosphate cytidylyltransferase [Actinomycetota bacterium]